MYYNLRVQSMATYSYCIYLRPGRMTEHTESESVKCSDGSPCTCKYISITRPYPRMRPLPLPWSSPRSLLPGSAFRGGGPWPAPSAPRTDRSCQSRRRRWPRGTRWSSPSRPCPEINILSISLESGVGVIEEFHNIGIFEAKFSIKIPNNWLRDPILYWSYLPNFSNPTRHRMFGSVPGTKRQYRYRHNEKK